MFRGGGAGACIYNMVIISAAFAGMASEFYRRKSRLPFGPEQAGGIGPAIPLALDEYVRGNPPKFQGPDDLLSEERPEEVPESAWKH